MLKIYKQKAKSKAIFLIASFFLFLNFAFSENCTDTDGDGWGWDGLKSCKMPGQEAKAKRSGARTKKKESLASSALPKKPLFNKERCDNWALIHYGDYMVQNNVWNDRGMYKKNYSLCIELTGTEQKPVPRWRYDFLTASDGGQYEVKSYPQVYYGHKRQSTPSGSAKKLGLPAKIENLENFVVKYKYSEKGKGERNVALESFFHTTCEIKKDNQEFEMMIWVGKPSIRTGGTNKIGEAEVDGAKWDIWLNKNLKHGYVAFVRQTPSNQGTINWNKFVDWTLNEGPKMGAPKLNKDSCMNTIELGTEIFWGKGEFILEEFDVSRK